MTLAREDANPGIDVAVDARDGWLTAVMEAQQLVRAAGQDHADPTVLLERLVATVCAMVDAPAAVAVPRQGRLVWWAASPEVNVVRGEPVDIDGTTCGLAWRSGQVTRSPGHAGQNGEPDRPESPTLVVPLVHGVDILGVLALLAPTPGWFDRADERAALLLARTAAAALGPLCGVSAAGTPGRPGELVLGPPTPAAPALPVAPRRAVDATRAASPSALPRPGGLGLWEWDAATDRCRWSEPIARLVGTPPGTRLTLTGARDAIAREDRARFDTAVRAVLSGRGVAGVLRLETGGAPRHVYAWSEVRRDRAGALTGAWGAVVDMTEFEQDAAALRSSLAGLRAAQQLTGLGVWEWHPDAGRLVWSPEMFHILGLHPGAFEPTLDRWHSFIHPEDVDRARRLDVGTLDAGTADPSHGERPRPGESVETFRVVRPDGEIRHVQSWSQALPLDGGDTRAGAAPDGAPVVVYGAMVDVTRQVRDRVMLEKLSATDAVTGLGNRIAFDRRMNELLAHPTGELTLMLLDLDRFKLVNDSLGHQVGDRLLVEVARRLVAVVPAGSVTARMGGDEFVVVPPLNTSEADVQVLAGAVVEALRAPYVLPESGEMLLCPVSIGIASARRRPVSVTELLRDADIALYRAKDAGGDRFIRFDDDLRARALSRQRAERRVREALDQDLLVLEYQPIVDFVDGRVVGAEALLRIRDPENGGLIRPDMFMDVAEDTGLVVELDSWVIDAAIAQVARWSPRRSDGRRAQAADPAQLPLPWLAVNVSARSVAHPRVVARLLDAVTRGELPPDRIKIELTEHSFLGALPGGEASLRSLMAAGVPVGIDDFGTGYSALAYLPRFDLDFMKIDRSFVSDVGQDERADAVVTAIVDLAHAHGMAVTAEGVETERQARRLREIGCDYAQGYHFGRPGEPDRIIPAQPRG